LDVVADVFPRRGEVWLVNLDPIVGREIAKTRPGIVVSPDELNAHLGTVIVAPLTTTIKRWPFRVAVRFARRNGSIGLDQMRAIDRGRLVRRIGKIDAAPVLSVLREMFAD
jgi:mRNA interferase MazF